MSTLDESSSTNTSESGSQGRTEEENEDAAGGVRNYGSTGSTPPMASSTSIALPRPRPSPFINGEGQSQSEIEQIRSMSVPSLPQALKRQTPLRGKTDVPVCPYYCEIFSGQKIHMYV